MGAMPWLVAMTLDRTGEASNKPKPWTPRHDTGSYISVRKAQMHQTLGQMVGARYLAQRTLIKDRLLDTRSQEAPCGEGVGLLGGLSNRLASKT